MANASSRQIIDAWAQPVFKEGLLPEAVRLFEQSGSAHLLSQDLSAAQLFELMDEPGRPVPYLDEVALTFPERRIVAWHIGYPWTDEMIGVAWKHENVYIDTSAHLPRNYPGRSVSNRYRQ